MKSVSKIHNAFFLLDLPGGYNCIWPLRACQWALFLNSLNPKRSDCQGGDPAEMKQHKNGNCNPSEMGGGREGSLLYSSVNINVLCCSPLHRTAKAIRFLFLPNQCQGSQPPKSSLPASKSQAFWPSSHSSLSSRPSRPPTALIPWWRRCPEVKTLPKSRFPSKDQRAQQHRCWNLPNPGHNTHTPDTREAREEGGCVPAPSVTGAASATFRTPGMQTPASGTSRLPTVWECSRCGIAVSLSAPGNPCSPLPPLCRCGPAWAGRRQTLLASPSNLTRNTPRGRSKLRQRSPGLLSQHSGTGFEARWARGGERDPSEHPSPRGRCCQARDPPLYAKTRHLQPGAVRTSYVGTRTGAW